MSLRYTSSRLFLQVSELLGVQVQGSFPLCSAATQAFHSGSVELHFLGTDVFAQLVNRQEVDIRP